MSSSKRIKSIIWSIVAVAVFGLLMVFGLKHNPNFTPSQLIGHPAPAFTAQNTQGKTVVFAPTVALNWTVINFWTSSCYVCRDEAKALQDFYQTVSLASTKNPQLLSINIQDDLEAISQWQKEFAQTFPVVRDTRGAISLNYGVTGTPETFLVDPEGLVRFRIAGAVNKKTILNFIEWLHKNPAANEEQMSQFYSSLSVES